MKQPKSAKLDILLIRNLHGVLMAGLHRLAPGCQHISVTRQVLSLFLHEGWIPPLVQPVQQLPPHGLMTGIPSQVVRIDFDYLVKRKQLNSKIQLKILRNKKEIDMDFVL